MSLTHSFELPEVKDATMCLISDNAEHLIRYIYSNKEQKPYNTPLVRIGLVLKTLLKTNGNQAVKGDVIEPAINDLIDVIALTKDPMLTDVYQEELRFLKSCTILDDMITLNTQRP
jgi:hypothetical protein